MATFIYYRLLSQPICCIGILAARHHLKEPCPASASRQQGLSSGWLHLDGQYVSKAQSVPESHAAQSCAMGGGGLMVSVLKGLATFCLDALNMPQLVHATPRDILQ